MWNMSKKGTIFQMSQKLWYVLKIMLFNSQKQTFSLWDHHKDNNIDNDIIHLFHSISIGHVPLFHFVSYIPFSLYNTKFEE
jgi:hypothetical protein